MKAAIVFMTGRADPQLCKVVDAIAAQGRPGDDIALVVIDALAAWDEKRDIAALGLSDGRLRAGGHGLSSIVYSAPKPTIWQGQSRVTPREYWATANARNTAFALIPDGYDYVAFIDDRATPGPYWLAEIRRGASSRAAVIAGSYEKHEGVAGRADNPPRIARDHRLELYPAGKPSCGGGWLYGCTFALPLAWALEVNGFEEGCDGLTGEDYIFGLMLGNRGRRIDFSSKLYVVQDRTPGNESCKGSYGSTDKGISPNDKSHAALATFGKAKRTDPRFTPDLTELRALRAAGRPWPDPVWSIRDDAGRPLDWFDKQPICEMA